MGYAFAMTMAPGQAAAPPARGSAPVRTPSPAPCGNQALLRRLQAKLKVGSVNDPLEHEADRVADQVTRMAAPAAMTSASPQVSRKCSACEEQVSRKCAACAEEEKLQKKEPGTQAAISQAPASVHETLRSPGRPLDQATRAYFEPRFGRDFSNVRVHTGSSAAQSAREVNAHAYTVGHDIAFDSGRFEPGSQDGRHLIAHELAHVVQQGGLGSGVRTTSQLPRNNIAAEGRAMLKAPPVATSQRPAATRKLSSPVIQRQPKANKGPEPPVSRSEEVQLSLRSPGLLTTGLNPPMISLYNFAIDQPALKPEHVDAVKALGSVIKRTVGAKLHIAANGHADFSGDSELNEPLSRQRAIAVQTPLQQISGVPVDPSWFGSRQPAVANDTVDGRSRNRRVDIYLHASGGIHHKPDDKKKPPKPDDKKKPTDDDGNGDGWDWSLPSPCDGIFGALICGIVACAAAFEICLFCLSNPEVCLGVTVPPKKRKEPQKPKDERPCPVKVDLPPAQTIQARQEFGPYGPWLAEGFSMNIIFKNDDTGCLCELGEYIQEIRGFAERDKGTGVMKPDNPPGMVLNANKYQEDLRGGLWHYGIRSEHRNEDYDEFLPERETGCEYHGADTPGMNGAEGEHMRFHFEFRGRPVDRRYRSLELMGQPWREWTVEGDWVVPHTA